MQGVGGAGPLGGRLAELWLNSDGQARLVIDRNLRILWWSDGAALLLSSAGPLTYKGDQLVGADRNAQSELATWVANTDFSKPALALVSAEGVEPQFLVRGRAIEPAPNAPIGLTIRSHAPDFDMPDLRQLFSLTAAEEQVIRQLLKGRSSAEIAQESEISVLTVRTHVKRAYSKLGIHSKEQLFAKLLGLVI